MHTLIIGGTGFVGRHTAAAFLEDGPVTTLGRRDESEHLPEAVTHLSGDRTEEGTLREAAALDPDVVVDCAAFYPGEIRTATGVFAEVDAYVYVSSGGVYAAHEIPKREDETPLHDCTPAQAGDDSMASYGPRKAECDREASAAADRGVQALIVRPTMVYGPRTVPSVGQRAVADGDGAPSWAADRPGLQGHHDYWIDRIQRFNRVVVPGDGTAIWHRAYVEDVAAAIRVVAKRGTAGEAYNIADRRVCTMDDVIGLIADDLGTTVETVHASERELAAVGLDPDDFVLYHHLGSRYPHILDTCKLAGLGWTSTPVEEAIARTVDEAIEYDRTGAAFDPGRDREAELIDALAG